MPAPTGPDRGEDALEDRVVDVDRRVVADQEGAPVEVQAARELAPADDADRVGAVPVLGPRLREAGRARLHVPQRLVRRQRQRRVVEAAAALERVLAAGALQRRVRPRRSAACDRRQRLEVVVAHRVARRCRAARRRTRCRQGCRCRACRTPSRTSGRWPCRRTAARSRRRGGRRRRRSRAPTRAGCSGWSSRGRGRRRWARSRVTRPMLISVRGDAVDRLVEREADRLAASATASLASDRSDDRRVVGRGASLRRHAFVERSGFDRGATRCVSVLQRRQRAEQERHAGAAG